MGADAPEAQEIAERLAAGDAGTIAWLYDNIAPDLYRRLRGVTNIRAAPMPPTCCRRPSCSACATARACCASGSRICRAGAPALPSLQGYLWDLACGVAANVRRSVWSRRAQPMPETAVAAEPPIERSAIARQALRQSRRLPRGSRGSGSISTSSCATSTA